MNALIIIVLLFPFTITASNGTTESIATTYQGNTNDQYSKTTISPSTNASFQKTNGTPIIPACTVQSQKTTEAKKNCGNGLFSSAICKRFRATDANKDEESIALKDVKRENELLVMQSEEDKVDDKDPLQVQTPAEVSTKTSGTEEERKLLEKEHTEGAGAVSEVDYATINYSLLQKKKDTDLNPKQAESDYAEIQIKKPNEGEEVQTVQHELEKDEVAQEGAKQDGGDQGLENGMESEKQVELEEVQV